MSDEVKSVSFDNFKHTISTFFQFVHHKVQHHELWTQTLSFILPSAHCEPHHPKKLSNQPYKPNKNNKEPITITKNNPVFIF